MVIAATVITATVIAEPLLLQDHGYYGLGYLLLLDLGYCRTSVIAVHRLLYGLGYCWTSVIAGPPLLQELGYLRF